MKRKLFPRASTRVLALALAVCAVCFVNSRVSAQDSPQVARLGGFCVVVDERPDEYAFLLQVGAEYSPNELGFARATIAKADVETLTIDPDAGTLTVQTKTKRFVFTGVKNSEFVTIDYETVGDVLLTSEEPLTWETTLFKESDYAKVQAYGTAGLKPVDGHNGSYAFLALVQPETRMGVVSGWITSEQSGGVVRSNRTASGVPAIVPRLDYGRFQTGGRVMRERFVIGAFDDCRYGLEQYAEAIAKEYQINPRLDALVGYCTWYAEKHGGACDEKSIQELTQALVDDFGDFGLQFVQIDSQWQSGESKNGENKNFTQSRPTGGYPGGMKPTADFITSHGLKAGLWLAPFSGNYDDPYFADKQELFAKSAIDYPERGEKNARKYKIDQKKGAPYETFWGGTAFDLSNPKTREYVRDVVERITKDWGFSYLKTDALWTGAAIEILYENNEYEPDDMGNQLFFDPTRTNIENFRTGLRVLRESSNGAFILGSVASQNMRVLASSYGMIDAMRVGPDNSADWERMRVGFRAATNRYFYNGRVWRNDPDPVYARTSIPIERARLSASWTALTGQLFTLGDWVPDYDAERIDLVRRCIPNHLRKTVRPVDLFDTDMARVWLLQDWKSGVERDVVGLFNWTDGDEATFELTPKKLGLSVWGLSGGKKIEKYVGYEFWTDRLLEPFDALRLTVPKESCAIVAVRALEDDRPVLLSTSRHITQGVLEVKSETWDAQTRRLTIETEITPGLSYELRVYDPRVNELKRWSAPEDAAGRATIVYDANSQAFELR